MRITFALCVGLVQNVAHAAISLRGLFVRFRVCCVKARFPRPLAATLRALQGAETNSVNSPLKVVS
jgi:hypothetical protein